MSKSVKLNGVTYSGISKVKLPLSDGAGQYAEFQDVDEISPSTAQIEISANGTYNVRQYTTAVVNVPTGGGGGGGSSPFTLVSTQTFTHSEDWSTTGKVGAFAALYCNAEDTTDSYLYIVKINNTFSDNNAAQALKVMRRIGEASTHSVSPTTNLIWLRAKRNNEVTPNWGDVQNTITEKQGGDYGTGPGSLSFFVGAGSTVTVKKYSVDYDWEG